MKIGKAEPVVMMCEPLELFSLEYFFNKGLLFMEGQDVCFYNMGAVVDKVRREPEESVVSADVENLRKEMAVIREELGGARLELQAIKGSIDILAERSSAQNERMSDAVRLMQRMAEWLEGNFSQTQQRLPPGPGNAARQPGHGSSSLYRPRPRLSL